jgi:DNA-binding CsgD family transcriptional regulator
MAALEGGNRGRATALIEEDLRESQGFGARPRVQLYDDLMGSAVLASLGGETARAARLWGAAEATREAVGLSLPIWEHTPTDFGVELDAARSRLGEEAFAAAWSEGRAMSAEEAVEYALGTEGDAPQDASASPLLSGREVEVLVLVAEGLTNPQVAQRLYLSPRTVGQHLRSVFRKLGVPSRAAAAREALERGLI